MTKTKRTFVTLNVTDGPSHQEILESLTPPAVGRGSKPPLAREFTGTFKDASDPSEVVRVPMLLRGALYKSRGDNDTLQVFGYATGYSGRAKGTYNVQSRTGSLMLPLE